MRNSCLDCGRKHLAQAIILMIEAEMGYPAHKWLAVGHMAEAEAELLEKYGEVAHEIRELRLAYMQDERVSLMPMIERLCDIETKEAMSRPGLQGGN